MGQLVGGGSVAVAVGVSDMWQVTGDRWHVRFSVSLMQDFFTRVSQGCHMDGYPLCDIWKNIWQYKYGTVDPKTHQTAHVCTHLTVHSYLHLTLNQYIYILHKVYQAKVFLSSPSLSLDENMVYVRARAEPRSEIPLPFEPEPRSAWISNLLSRPCQAWLRFWAC